MTSNQVRISVLPHNQSKTVARLSSACVEIYQFNEYSRGARGGLLERVMFAFFPTQPPLACLEMWLGIVERGILAFKNQPIVFVAW